MGTVLNVKGLSCGYGERHVIRDVSFSLAQGGFLGIIGPNGAGKSTLLKCITRLIPVAAGSIEYQGKNIFRYRMHELAKHIAVIPQVLDVPFSFSVEEFVSMGRFPHVARFQRPSAHDAEAIDNALALTDVTGLRQRNMDELSEGEKQRVVIAQGLAQEPSFLILDEPTSHLDITHQVQLLNLLRRLNNEQGLTVLTVLHDLNLAGEFCKSLILMREGTVHTAGLPQEVLTYQNIEEVYKTVVIVKENPMTKKPYVIVVPKEIRREK